MPRPSGIHAALFGFFALSLAPVLAHAEDGTEIDDMEDGETRPGLEVEAPIESSKRFSTAITLNWWTPQDESLRAAYGSRAQLGWGASFGVVPWSRYIHTELNLGVGWRMRRANALGTSTGETSDLSENVMITFPFHVELLVGIDIVHEQPVVPYARIGLDFLAWNEKEPTGNTPGTRFGWHWAVGGAVLLDFFAPARADAADRRNSINDAYLTFEYRRVDYRNFGRLEEGLLDFSGPSFQVSLALVY